MLSEHDRQLVATAVDGELTDGTESVVRRLLADSAEARALFRDLLADREALRSLPRLVAPANTADLIIRRVERLPRAVPATAGRRLQRWSGYAVAASVFLAIGALSFWASRTGGEQAKRTGQGEGAPRRPVREQYTKPPRLESLPSPRPVDDPSHAQGMPVQRDRVPSAEIAPPPRAAVGTVIASSPQLVVDLIRNDGGRLPLLLPFDQYDQPEVRQRAVKELDGPSRIDFFCPSLYLAVELFQTSARASGVRIIPDTTTQELAGNRRVTGFAIYTESLTADEIAGLLADVARHAREAGSRAFGTAHLYPITPADQRDVRELRDLLGVDPGLWKRPKPAPAGLKPLAAGTVDQLEARLGKNSKTALLLTYLPVSARTVPAASQEIRTFLAARGERKPGAVPLFVVFRPDN
jgi:anti-sigma factor RsiW